MKINKFEAKDREGIQCYPNLFTMIERDKYCRM